MKLYYKQKCYGMPNFGDALNPWIWEKLLPGMFDGKGDILFLGIGSILGPWIPKSPKKVVFGTGAGGRCKLQIDKTWVIYCVRGPLTANALGVSENLAIVDGAYLIRNIYEYNLKKLFDYSYMPHIKNAIDAAQGLESICKKLGWAYIDPRWPVNKVINMISSTKVLLSEAIHGAIVADALRVPWIPICTEIMINHFKWQDWCMSIGLEYHPTYVFLSSDLYQLAPGPRSALKYLYRFLKQHKSKGLKMVFCKNKEAFAAQLQNIAEKESSFLSDKKIADKLFCLLEEKLETLKIDFPGMQK